MVLVMMMSMVLVVVSSISRVRAQTKGGPANQQRTAQQK
jgi:hypothetical protein